MGDSKSIGELRSIGLSRRSFLAWSAALGGTAAVMAGLPGCGMTQGGQGAGDGTFKPIGYIDEDAGVWMPSPCKTSDGCAEICMNLSLVVDGVVVRTKPYDDGVDSPDNPLRKGCLRGRAYRTYVYGEERLRYPMKRKNWQPGGGANSNGHLRGIDEWERISWEEALDLIAEESKRILDQYGNTAIVEGGVVFNHLGGTVALYGVNSEGNFPMTTLKMCGTTNIDYYMLGGYLSGGGSDRLAQRDANLIVYWCLNTAWTSPATSFYNMQLIRQSGARHYVVTPELNSSAIALGATWIPVRPGTDCTLLLSMAYHMIENDLHDQEFLDRCCIGFDADHMPEGVDPKENFKDYVLGTYDGVPKTPEWASEICGTDPDVIRAFTEDIVNTSPCVFDCNNGAWRTHRSQQFGQAFFTVGWMTGHFGTPGGGVSVDRQHGYSSPKTVFAGQTGEDTKLNPLFLGAGYFGGYGFSDPFDEDCVAIAYDELWAAILDKEYTHFAFGKKPIDIRMYVATSGNNKMDQSGTMKALKALRSLDFFLAGDIQLSTKSKYADIVLPDTLGWEEDGYMRTTVSPETIVFGEQLIQPTFETRSMHYYNRELAARMGLDPDEIHPLSEKQKFFNSVSGSTYLDETFEMVPCFSVAQEDIDDFGVEGEPHDGLIPFKQALEIGGFTMPRSKGDVYQHYAAAAVSSFKADPEGNPAKTESGKLEIYCGELKRYLEAYGFDDNVEPIARYQPPIEGFESTFSDWENRVKGDYPLQMSTPHYIRGAHSTYNGVPWLRRAHPREVNINRIDADPRSIKTGDTILISSPRGKILRRAKVTDHIIPGVITVTHGSWNELYVDETIDKGGASGTLLADRPCGQGMQPFNTSNVQVEKWTGDPLEPDWTWPARVPIEE